MTKPGRVGTNSMHALVACLLPPLLIDRQDKSLDHTSRSHNRSSMCAKRCDAGRIIISALRSKRTSVTNERVRAPNSVD